MSPHVVVVGGGHNGLVAANYLARFGMRVTLLEARPTLGGMAGRLEYLPGYLGAITNSPGSLEGRIIQELELARHGLRFVSPDVTLLQRMGEGLFVGWRDRDRVAAQLETFATGEAKRHRLLVERLDALGAASGLSLWEPPPSLQEALDRMPTAVRDEFRLVVLDGSLNDLLAESLRTDAAKSLMMMLALNGQLVSPDAPGSAMGLLMRPISRASSTEDVLGIGDAPLRGSVGLPVGSMSAIVDALARAAGEHGVQIRTNAPVVRLELAEHGQVTAVVLESGEQITGVDMVVSAVEPSRLATMLPSGALTEAATPEPPEGSAFKIALALDSLPGVAGAPEDVPLETLLSAQFRVAPDPAYITAAVEDGIAGRPSAKPIMWGLIPSLTSEGLAPKGKHLMSINVWHAPYRLGREYWREHGATFFGACLAQLEESFPGLQTRIEDARWFSPHDLEDEFGLTGSNITHGDMLPSQLLDGRPGTDFTRAARSMGIVVGGAGSWPGGYVTGAPGRNAATLVNKMVRSLRLR
ncbi:phytoene desaturase family protein [Saccharopolyspora spinosa]|uniref:Pyridine nucleotide-disulfide oxidoreductase domain-containing protein 2 n=1 Tax=Saccharopolyspora spinosa TaxID=60894 RepID=A0A2N3Y675_SACSN|nr:NAD(P)/FAD-dependent oxidoreductase [Saccharopolyspora spinosa]PKW18424.1 phytoene dehydrogenase-like protein [Saccharopolyspora spinosa]